MRITKMHGAGNDYVYVNCFEPVELGDVPELARRISDRHFGVGGDGLVLICPSERGDARMRMFNADGSESEMCGNAIRCVAKYVYDHGIAKKDELRIETGRGVLTLQCSTSNGLVDRVRVNMAQPILTSAEIPTTLPGDPPVKHRPAGRSPSGLSAQDQRRIHSGSLSDGNADARLGARLRRDTGLRYRRVCIRRRWRSRGCQ